MPAQAASRTNDPPTSTAPNTRCSGCRRDLHDLPRVGAWQCRPGAGLSVSGSYALPSSRHRIDSQHLPVPGPTYALIAWPDAASRSGRHEEAGKFQMGLTQASVSTPILPVRFRPAPRGCVPPHYDGTWESCGPESLCLWAPWDAGGELGRVKRRRACLAAEMGAACSPPPFSTEYAFFPGNARGPTPRPPRYPQRRDGDNIHPACLVPYCFGISRVPG